MVKVLVRAGRSGGAADVCLTIDGDPMSTDYGGA